MSVIPVPMWVQYVAAIGPAVASLIVALLVSFISYKSWRTAKAKLNFDLFDRRLSAYIRMVAVIRGTLEPAIGASSQLISSPSGTVQILELELDEIRFLFGRNVSEAYEQAVNEIGPVMLEKHKELIVEAETEESRAEEALYFHESIAERMKQEAIIRMVCLPYLDFSRWRG